MKKLITVLLALAVAGSLVGCLYAVKTYKKDPPLPVLDGEVRAPGLSGTVDVYRDRHGVPHVFADSEHDLFFGAGYVQAQDRLFEMVIIRAMAEGRIAELLGDIGVPGMKIMGMPFSTIEIDRAQRIMGMKYLGEVGEALLKERDPEIYNQLQAFCDGVNYYIKSRPDYEDLPIELQVLRTRPEPFRVADVISLGRYIGNMLSANMGLELARYTIMKKYGKETAWKLYPLHDAPGPTIVPKDMLKNKLSNPRELPPGGKPADSEMGYDTALSADSAAKLLAVQKKYSRMLSAKAPLASNNWIVSPKLTENGTALFANDPHLSHMQPSLFYMIRLKGAGIDAYGVTFPGNPYVVLGHTRKLAWGATTTQADVQDLFIETVDPDRPGMYKYKGEWVPFVDRKEVIKVRVGNKLVEREFSFRQSVHGPIINDLVPGKLPEDCPPVALRWTGWDFDRDVRVHRALMKSKNKEEFLQRYRQLDDKNDKVMNVAAMYNILMRGDSIEDFKRAMNRIVLPNQAWVAADADGHIAFLPGGLVPVRNKGIGVAPVPGESGEFDWKGFIPLMEVPHAIDPERGYVATSNNEVVDAEYYPHVFATNYGPGWRAWRVEELIKELAPLDLEDMESIQNDVKVKKAEWMMPYIRRAMQNKNPKDPLARKALGELNAWDFEADLQSSAVVLFFKFTDTLRKNVLADELEQEDYEKFLESRHMNMLINMRMEDPDSDIFDDKRTKKTEDRDDMIVKSLSEAMASLENEYGEDPAGRQWGRLHTITFSHPLAIGPLSDLSVGPFPHLGATHTVRNAYISGSGDNPWSCSSGPVLRHLMDMGDPERAKMIIDGSQSGMYKSPHYRDLHPLWVKGQYLEATMDPAAVKKAAPNHLALTP
ncbi:MAG: penicillin acylase family protein [bacterium]